MNGLPLPLAAAAPGDDEGRGAEPLTPGVRRAGGIVVAGDLPLVALVHRPKRDDWGFPKGRIDPGEPAEACARREVLEETGLRCVVLGFAGHATGYGRRSGRPKPVAYWLMRPVGGAFRPGDEVDELRWCDVAGALGALTRDHDRDLLMSVAGRIAGRSVAGRPATSWRARSSTGGAAG